MTERRRESARETALGWGSESDRGDNAKMHPTCVCTSLHHLLTRPTGFSSYTVAPRKKQGLPETATATSERLSQARDTNKTQSTGHNIHRYSVLSLGAQWHPDLRRSNRKDERGAATERTTLAAAKRAHTLAGLMQLSFCTKCSTNFRLGTIGPTLHARPSSSPKHGESGARKRLWFAPVEGRIHVWTTRHLPAHRPGLNDYRSFFPLTSSPMMRPALFPALHDSPVRHAISTSFISPEVAVRSAGRRGCLLEAVLEQEEEEEVSGTRRKVWGGDISHVQG